MCKPVEVNFCSQEGIVEDSAKITLWEKNEVPCENYKMMSDLLSSSDDEEICSGHQNLWTFIRNRSVKINLYEKKEMKNIRGTGGRQL